MAVITIALELDVDVHMVAQATFLPDSRIRLSRGILADLHESESESGWLQQFKTFVQTTTWASQH